MYLCWGGGEAIAVACRTSVAREIPSASLRASSSLRLKNGSGQDDALLGRLWDLRFLQFVAGRNFEQRGMRLLGGGGLAVGGLLARGGSHFG